MKFKLSVFFAMLLTASMYGQSNAIDKFFSAYENDANFTVVTISPKMFDMVTNFTNEMDNKEVKDMIKDIKGLKILTSEKEGMKYYNDAIKKLPVSEYEVLMTVKDKGNNVRFLTKGKGDVVDELLLLVGGDQFVMMSFVGKLDLNKIAKLAKTLDIEGSEHLDKLKNKK